MKNMTSIKTSSEGAWRGDNPLSYAFPLLIVQTLLVLFTTRLLAFLLKPLRQPRVVAEILGGILLGPSALGRNKDFFHLIFPPWSTPILESIASFGLLFYLFLVGMELDLATIRQSCKRAFGIALAGISLPFVFGIAVSFFLRKAVTGVDKVPYGQYLMFMGVALSITAFPILARILAELKLLTTQVGQTAMAAAALNDIAAWVLLEIGIALAGNGTSPLIALWVFFSGSGFVGFMLIFVRPMMNWVARKGSSDHEFMDEACFCLTLAGVLLSGFMTDLIGIHSIFGAFIFGLTIPKGGEFATRLIKRIEDFVSGLLLPLYFASSGLKTNVTTIRGVEAWGLLVLVISTACVGKILGTFVVAMLCMIPARESLTLGFLMNTKGLVELIVLNIGKERKVLNDEMFAILVLMALFTTFITTPTVLAIYKPQRRIISQSGRRAQREQQSPLHKCSEEELRILACIHGPDNVPALINLIESTTSAANESPVKVYVIQLVEFTDRSSSIMMVQRARKNGLPFINCFSQGKSKDRTEAAFDTYGRMRQVKIHHSTIISGLSDMHEDICHVVEEQRARLIILPFHIQGRSGEGEDARDMGHGWMEVNERVLNAARGCVVAIFIDRGFGSSDQDTGHDMTNQKRICILFCGGADDRQALMLGCRMAENSAYKITIVRLLEGRSSSAKFSDNNSGISAASTNTTNEMELDGAALEEFNKNRNDRTEYHIEEVHDVTKKVITIGKSRDFDLLIVGKGAAVKRKPGHHVEHPELGIIGDTLASSDRGILPSVLVVQKNSSSSETMASNSIQAKKEDDESAIE